MPEITPTPDCCKVWPRLLAYFGWFSYADDPGLLAMPYLEDASGEMKWRVNYCPACGSPVRECIVTKAALERSRSEDVDG